MVPAFQGMQMVTHKPPQTAASVLEVAYGRITVLVSLVLNVSTTCLSILRMNTSNDSASSSSPPWSRGATSRARHRTASLGPEPRGMGVASPVTIFCLEPVRETQLG